MAKINYRVDNVESIPEELKQFYVEDKEGGGFHLDTETKLVPNQRLAEFRDTNIKLQKQLDDLSKKYENVDPQEYFKLKEGKVEELDEKVRDRTQQLADEKNTLQQQLLEQTNRYQSSLLETAITMAASQNNVRPEATVDVINRARSSFRFVEDKPIAWDGAKNEPLYDSDGVTKITPERWVAKLVKSAPHFFQPSTGGNSPGNKSNSVGQKPPVGAVDSFKRGLQEMGFTDDE